MNWAMFLDFDGSIVDTALTPWSVHIPERLPPLLIALRQTMGGAVAIVTGRTIEQIDSYLGPILPAVAASHGLERRTAEGDIICPALPLDAVRRVRGLLEKFAARHSGVIVEDKINSVALHYRQAPLMKRACRDTLNDILKDHIKGWEIVESKFIYDIRPSGVTKGTAIEAFMNEAPFLGRTPIFCGNDLTDEDGFAAVNARGGVSIRVGTQSHTLAQVQVATVTELLNWLTQVSRTNR